MAPSFPTLLSFSHALCSSDYKILLNPPKHVNIFRILQTEQGAEKLIGWGK